MTLVHDVLLARTPAPPAFTGAWARYLDLQQDVEACRAGSVNPAINLLLIGDSLIQEWPEALWKPKRVLNLGSGGDKTQQVLWRLDQIPPQAIAPAHVLLLIGVNNIGQGETADGTIEGQAAIMAKLNTMFPAAALRVATTLPYIIRVESQGHERRRLVEQMHARFGSRCLSLETTLADENGSPFPQFYREDGVHLSAAGYAVLTEALKPIIFENDSRRELVRSRVALPTRPIEDFGADQSGSGSDQSYSLARNGQ